MAAGAAGAAAAGVAPFVRTPTGSSLFPKAPSVDTAGGASGSPSAPSADGVVSPDHASDGSDGAGTTFNGYEIPERTPEVRQRLDDLAAQPDSPIVRNPDGSYSLAETIPVRPFEMKNPKHDWNEFQRQVGLQQRGLNQLTVAEWRHNQRHYDSNGRVAKAEQAAANQALQAAGVDMNGQAVLHGPDQVAGGRPDRFDGPGDGGVNSSLGNQWRHRVGDLRAEVDMATIDIDRSLLPHIRVNVEFGALNIRDGGAAAPAATLASAHAFNDPSVAVESAGSSGPEATSTPDSRDTSESTAGVDGQASEAPGADSTSGQDAATGESSSGFDDRPETSESVDRAPAHEVSNEQITQAIDGRHEILDSAFDRLDAPESRTESVQRVNEAGYRADPDRFGNNCHHVVNALELRMRGYDVIASPTVQSASYDFETQVISDAFEGRYPHAIAADWVQADGTRREFESINTDDGTTPQQALQNATAEWPEGARGFILGQWKAGGGHIFSIVKDATGVHLIDGQVNVADASRYLDRMRFGDLDHPAQSIQVMRVDDLVPTAEILQTSTSASPAEVDLIEQWGSSQTVADLPPEMIVRERVRNARWRQRNLHLIAELDAVIADVDTTPEARAVAQDRKGGLEYQNWALETGAFRFDQTLQAAAPVTTDMED